MKQLFRYDPHAARAPIEVDGEQLLPSLLLLPNPKGTLEPEGSLPCVVDDDLCIVPHMSRYFRFLRNEGLSVGSIESYAKDLLAFDRYLHQVLGRGLLSATTEDVAEYRILRLEGPGGVRLSGASWKRAAASLNRFYEWAADPEVALMSSSPKTRIRRGGARSEATVRFISMPLYIKFRDELKGSGRRNSRRNVAFSEFLVTSGFRLQEANNILLCEINSHMNFAMKNASGVELFNLPEAITKGKRARQVPISRRVMSGYLNEYLREERAQAVIRWRDAGGVKTISRPLVGWLVGNGRVEIVGEAAARLPSQFTLAERRRLLLIPGPRAAISLAEPALLWLNVDGSPCTSGCWSSVFRRASVAIGASISPHTLRHTFAVNWLSALIRMQLASDAGEGSGGLRGAYYKVTLDPLRILQRWMGHSSYLTTQKYLNYVDDVEEIIDLANEDIEATMVKYAGNIENA